MTLWRSIWHLSRILGIAVVVSAGAPLSSPRPVPRPISYPVPDLPLTHPSTRAQEAGLGVILQNIFRPVPRGNLEAAILPPPYDPDLAIGRSPRPVLRPRGLASTAIVYPPPPPANAGSRRGSVCGQRQIRGVVLAAIRERVAGCGLENPVRISSVSGVRLTQEAIMDCNTATTLNEWVREGAIPAVGRRGRGLGALRIISHYSCRTRNNQAGAKISEHGKGHAIDIAGVILKNGDAIEFLDDWGGGRDGRILRALHQTACGPFGTVLGPDANRAHRDHLHVDTAEYRGGSYCR